MDLSPRAVIAGRYRVDTKVGAGGMGEVWLGEQIALGVRVAVKTLLPAAAMNHEVVARFKREAYILGRIRSDNVARVVDFVADDVYGLVLVMEFVDGDPLSRLLQERTLTVEEGVDLAIGLANALKDLHGANIIHRDLKPGNIMMQPTPDGRRRAVVVDFGVSRLMNDKDKDEDEELTGITRADMAVGTIEYMAPEQILNSRNVTPGSDIYAAGAMLFRSCAGRHVFGSVSSDAELAQKKLTTESPPLPLSRTDKVAEGFAKVVAKMVKRRPSERYKTADDVLADLLPIRDLQHAAAAEDSTTIDASKGAAAAGVAAAVAATAETAVAKSEARTVPVTPKAIAVLGAAPAPVSDSGVGVTALQDPPPAAPERRGVPPVVTFGLVAAALVGGVLLGPRLLQPMNAAADRTPAGPTATAVVTATPVPSTTATAADPVTAAATAAPTSTASLVPEPSATAAAEDAGAGKGLPPGRAPGPMPKANPTGLGPATTSAPPVLPKPLPSPLQSPIKVEPTQL